MQVVEHTVSFRGGKEINGKWDGKQIMVKGLDPSLLRMGYRWGARVRVTDPNKNPANDPWDYVVRNNEHATLACQDPPPPMWIQKGVRMRIEVLPPDDSRIADSQPPPTSKLLTWMGNHLARNNSKSYRYGPSCNCDNLASLKSLIGNG